jgi:putative oxidoreductase
MERPVTEAPPIVSPRSGAAQKFRSPPLNRALDLIGRAAIAFLFVDAARYHLSHAGWHRTLDDMQARGLPAPQPLLVIAMAASTLLALALLFGVKQRLAALGLALYAIGVSLVMYNPFAHLGQGALVLFLKDLCIFGALLSLSRALPDTGWHGRRLSG